MASDDVVCLPGGRACSAATNPTCTTATLYSIDSAQIESKIYTPIEFAVM